RVYVQVEQEFGVLAPPIALHSPSPETMAAAWLMLRESMLAPGLVGRAHKEAIAAAVSLGNTCPYCVTVHGAALDGLVRGRAANAIVSDRIELVADPEIRTLAAWARAGSVLGGGDIGGDIGTGSVDGVGNGAYSSTARRVGFPARHAPENVGVAVTFH